MRSIRVNKLKEELENYNPSTKLWVSEERPGAFTTLKDLVNELNADQIIELDTLLEARKYQVAMDILSQEQRDTLYQLGFAVSKIWD